MQKLLPNSPIYCYQLRFRGYESETQSLYRESDYNIIGKALQITLSALVIDYSKRFNFSSIYIMEHWSTWKYQHIGSVFAYVFLTPYLPPFS